MSPLRMRATSSLRVSAARTPCTRSSELLGDRIAAAALLASGPLAAHAVYVALDRAVREGELRTEGPAAAPRALPRRTHEPAPTGRPNREDVMNAAQGTLAVGRTAGRGGH